MTNNPLLILGNGAPDTKGSDLTAAPIGSIYIDKTNLPSTSGANIWYQDSDPTVSPPLGAIAKDICKNTETGNEFQLQADEQTWKLVYSPFVLPNGILGADYPLRKENVAFGSADLNDAMGAYQIIVSEHGLATLYRPTDDSQHGVIGMGSTKGFIQTPNWMNILNGTNQTYTLDAIAPLSYVRVNDDNGNIIGWLIMLTYANQKTTYFRWNYFDVKSQSNANLISSNTLQYFTVTLNKDHTQDQIILDGATLFQFQFISGLDKNVENWGGVFSTHIDGVGSTVGQSGTFPVGNNNTFTLSTLLSGGRFCLTHPTSGDVYIVYLYPIIDNQNGDDTTEVIIYAINTNAKDFIDQS